MTVLPIDRKTGMQASEGGANVIMEAFKPGTGPAGSYSVIGMDTFSEGSPVEVQSPNVNRAIQGGGGGLF